jgi:CBS domain-containing protein
MGQVVSSVMTPKPRTIRAEDSLTKAAKAMRAADAGAVIVRDGNRICGILTDRDIVVRALADGCDPAEVHAGDICSKDVATVAPTDDVDFAISIMLQRRVRRVPVVEAGRTVGIVSLGDLAIDRDPRSLLGEISAAPGNS